MTGFRGWSELCRAGMSRLTAAAGDRMGWLSGLLCVAPLQLGAEVERSARRRRAAARLNTSVMARVQGASALTRQPEPDGTGVDRLRSLMSEVARRADR